MEEQTREILRKVRQVEIRARRELDAALVGNYHSIFKGRGIDFLEVREYLPGDDVRAIDWNVTAKASHPYIKVFHEERELTLLLVVDVSASGEFGSTSASKRQIAAEVASLLAFSAIRNQDKVGLLLLSDQVELYLPPRKGRGHVLRVIRDILFFQPRSPGTRLRIGLEALNRALKRRAVIFLISDFLDPEFLAGGAPRDTLAKRLSVTAQRHELISLEVIDPREEELPDVGRVILEDAESGHLVRLDTGSPKVRARYANLSRQRRADLTKLFRQRGVDHLPLRTDRDYLRALRLFFRQRASQTAR